MAFGVTTSPMNTLSRYSICIGRGNQSGLTTEGGQVTTLGINSFRYDLFLPVTEVLIVSSLIRQTPSTTRRHNLFLLVGLMYTMVLIGFGNTTLAVMDRTHCTVVVQQLRRDWWIELWFIRYLYCWSVCCPGKQ